MIPDDFEILDEVILGNTFYRLVRRPGSEHKRIQLWSSLSKTWRTYAKDDVANHWYQIKKDEMRCVKKL